MKKNLFFITVCLVSLIFALGFYLEDPGKKNTDPTHVKINTGIMAADHNPNATVIYVDSLNGDNSIAGLRGRGYKTYYRGTGPQGTSQIWYQGDPASFGASAFNGPTTGFVQSDYNSVTGTNTIDNWLVSPQLNLVAGDSLKFYALSYNSNAYPDSARIMYSAAGDTLPEATSWVELGRFLFPSITTLNQTWTLKKYGIPSNGASGRFAIRYCVANAGPTGNNSSTIGLDMIYVERNSTPVTFAWSEQTSGVTTELSSVSAVSDNVCWICGAGGKVLKTINGGTNWTSYTLPATDDAYNIFAYDENTALVTTSPTAGTYVYRTSNGGANWTQVLFVSGGFGDALWMTDANTAYFMGDPIGGNWLLKKSTNGGVNWTDWATVPTTITGGWNNSFFIRGSKVWFGSNTTTVMYSSNSGANWTTQTTPTANQYGIWFNDDNNGMAIYQSLSATTNGGTNWSALTSPVTYYGAGVCGTATKWWATTQNTTPDVYYSSNNGANWTTQYTAPTAGGVFRHLSMARNGNTIWGCRSLGGISKYGTSTGITPIGTVTPVDYTLSQNYPNPFNPTTKINFAIPKSGMVTLKVYNVLGKEVATLVNQNMTAGTYNYEFNASNLSSGIYFYKLDVNGFSQVKKMSLVK